MKLIAEITGTDGYMRFAPICACGPTPALTQVAISLDAALAAIDEAQGRNKGLW